MPLPSEIVALAPHLAAVATTTGLTVVGRNAIARVLGGLADLAMTPIDDVNQKLKDRREARSTIAKAIAQAAATVAEGDQDLVRRALATQFTEATRKQKARETVARIAIENLAEPSTSNEEIPNAKGSDTDVDEDWLNTFTGYAERASSDRMQQLWGKVLAGEIQKPGNYSIQSMRLLSEMTSNVAELFTQAVSMSCGDSIVSEGSGISTHSASILEANGLLSGSGGTFSRSAEGGKLTLVASGAKASLGIEAKTERVTVYLLTSSGLELKKLLPPPDELDVVRKNAIALAKKRLGRGNKYHVILNTGNSRKTIEVF